MNGKNSVVAIVTTFRPNSSLLPKSSRLLMQCDAVVLVDDTGESDTSFFKDNKFFFENEKKISYVKNLKNSGIAYSLNKGVEHSLILGCDYIVTFDDDTVCCPDYVNRCLAFFDNNDNRSISAVCMSRGSEFTNGRSAFKEKRSLITSGFFCHSSVYQTISMFPDEYFIDLVDFYLSLKIRERGFKLIELSEVGMIHKVGDMKTISNPIKVNVFNHSPFRLYYQVRNTIPFFKKFWKIDFLFCFYVSLDIVRIPLKALLFEDRKIERIKYCVKGFVDGVFGRMGRLND